MKYERRFDGLSFSFPPLPLPPVAVAVAPVRSSDVSSRMGSLGDGNGGGAELLPARAWRKKGMVEMSGESAHGFVREARSWSLPVSDVIVVGVGVDEDDASRDTGAARISRARARRGSGGGMENLGAFEILLSIGRMNINEMCSPPKSP